MLFWNRAGHSALPNVRRERGESSTDGLFLVDPQLGDRLEGTVDFPHSQLELVEDSRTDWEERIRSAGRRTFDIAFSSIALLVSSPLMLIIVLIIRLSSPGPAFYRQRRLGLRGRPFDCLKFRTMVSNADEVLADLLRNDPDLRKEFEDKHKLTNDPRITGIGHILRRTSLDELPQFLNVLKGEMSVVGPRPIVSEEESRYGPSLDMLLSVRPGITGLWQVSGRNDLTYDMRVELDCSYVQNKNLVLDLKIIFKTLWVMIAPSNGAY